MSNAPSSLVDDLDFLSLAGKPKVAPPAPAMSPANLGFPGDEESFSSPFVSNQPAIKISTPVVPEVDASNSFGFPDNFTPLGTPSSAPAPAVVDDGDDIFNPKPQPPRAPPTPPQVSAPTPPTQSSSSDPFAVQIVDPFAAPSGRTKPIDASSSSDPFAPPTSTFDPFQSSAPAPTQQPRQLAPSSSDPFATPADSYDSRSKPSSDPFAKPSSDPFAQPSRPPVPVRSPYPTASNPFTAGGGTNPFSAGGESVNPFGAEDSDDVQSPNEKFRNAYHVDGSREDLDEHDGYADDDYRRQQEAATMAVGVFPRPDLESEPPRTLF